MEYLGASVQSMTNSRSLIDNQAGTNFSYMVQQIHIQARTCIHWINFFTGFFAFKVTEYF